MSDFWADSNENSRADQPEKSSYLAELIDGVSALFLTPYLGADLKENFANGPADSSAKDFLASLVESLKAPVPDWIKACEKRLRNLWDGTVRKGAFQNFIQPELDAALGQARENAPFAAPISKASQAMILDDLIHTLDENGEDSAWLHELKNIDFPIIFQDAGEEISEAEKIIGGITIQDGEGFQILMNARKFPEYSPKMKSKLLHELRHLWQHYQDSWKPRFGNGSNTKTDMSVEVDAYKKQFALEKILGVKATFVRNFFDEIDRENLSPALKQYYKAARLYGKDSPVGYKTKGTYRLKTSDEYRMEFGE